MTHMGSGKVYKYLCDSEFISRFGLVDILDSLPNLVTVHDLDFRFMFINGMTRKFFPGADIGSSCFETVHGTSSPPAFCPLKATYRDGKCHSNIFYHPKLNRQLLVNTSPLFDPDGNIAGAIHVVNDVTHIKNIENKYIEQKTIYDFIFENSPLGILLTKDRFMLHVNEAFERITGYSRKELIGRSTRMLYRDQKTFETLGAKAAEMLRTNKVFSLEERLVRKDGSEIPLKASCRKVGGLDNVEGDAVVWIVEDLSREKEIEKVAMRLKERAERARRLESLGIFASGIAHDFNNILTPIMGYAELAQYSTTDDQQRRRLSLITDAAARAKDLIENLLKFSRGEEEGIVTFDITENLRKNIKLIKAMLPSSIEVTGMVENMPLYVLGNPSLFNEAIMNLCINALHAIGDKGTGTIEIGSKAVELKGDFIRSWADAKPGRYVHLWVRDTGSGMDRDTLSRIFDPYFTTKEPGKGTGLGLSMVFRYVNANGGLMDVSSKVGQGTTFHIYFPQCDGAVALKEGGGISCKKPCLNGLKILLVDDEKSVLTLASEFLEFSGAEVLACNRPEKALEAVARSLFKPDVLITDFTMPKMTGDQLIMRCRSHLEGLPAVIISGFGTMDGAGLRGISFVKKPFRMVDLIHAIKTAMGDFSGIQNTM